jgi:multimeric flavodoxin WrbA
MLGAKEASLQAEKIFLRDENVNYCLGCFACQSNGGNYVHIHHIENHYFIV